MYCHTECEMKRPGDTRKRKQGEKCEAHTLGQDKEKC